MAIEDKDPAQLAHQFSDLDIPDSTFNSVKSSEQEQLKLKRSLFPSQFSSPIYYTQPSNNRPIATVFSPVFPLGIYSNPSQQQIISSNFVPPPSQEQSRYSYDVSPISDSYSIPKQEQRPEKNFGVPNLTPPVNSFQIPLSNRPVISNSYALPTEAPTKPSKSYGLPAQTTPEAAYGPPESNPWRPVASSAPENEYGLPTSAPTPAKEYGPPISAPSPSKEYGPPTTAAPPKDSGESWEGYGWGPSSSSEGGYGSSSSDSSSSSEGGYGSHEHTPSSSYGPPKPAEKEIRFLIHKPGQEELVKETIIEESKKAGEEVSFLRGPWINIDHKQKVYLPPPKKTIVYILLKEPIVHTKIEVMDPKPQEMPKPEVFIVYENPEGVIKKHYDLTVEEGQRVAAVLGDKIRYARDSFQATAINMAMSVSTTTTMKPTTAASNEPSKKEEVKKN